MRLSRIVGLAGPALGILALVASLWAVYEGLQFIRSEFPDVTVLRSRFPIVIHQGRKEPPLVKLQRARPDSWVALGEISKVAVGAVVVSEDWAFYQHKGYDVNQIREAIKEDLEEGRFVRGASTITQQVARNVFLSKDKNLWRKIKELYLAVKLEEEVGKRKILETYFNVAEWGEGIYGIGAAARHYFGKHPSQLSAREGAFLAMLLPSPIRYGQSFRAKQLTEYARETIDAILKKMAQARFLTEEERDSAMNSQLSFEARALEPEALPSPETDASPVPEA